MHDALAEHLLSTVLDWTSDDVQRERPRLEAMASYKYDEYQQFQPGMRFIESLILWLQQFTSVNERRIAYTFVMERLIFLSSAEMTHLVRSVYPDLIRPVIRTKAALAAGIPKYLVGKVVSSVDFKLVRRKSLFLGLSDGSRTDIFRRSTRGEISNEQIFQTHELSQGRAEKMVQELNVEVAKICEIDADGCEHHFETVFLLDDFTGSGMTYLRTHEGELRGKLARLFESAQDAKSEMAALLDIQKCDIHLVFYVATTQAIEHIRSLLGQLCGDVVPTPEIHVIHKLADDCRVCEPKDGAFYHLCKGDDYYDPSLEDTSTKVGGSDVKLGFSEGALPLVLSHNTPNNSIALLWSYECSHFRGLFPRIPRHIDAI